MLTNRIQELKKEIIEFATHVENMINKSINGLIKRDISLLNKVIVNDEPVTNKFELKIDEHCTNVIAQYQPTAGDLRTILMIFKIGNDLERLGDEAVNISKSALFLVERPHIKIEGVDISRLAEESLSMLKDSISSFVNKNVQLANDVCLRDNIVDDYRDKSLKNLINYIREFPSSAEQILHVINISRKLERVADLSTNICEDIIFMVEGKVIKHAFNQ